MRRWERFVITVLALGVLVACAGCAPLPWQPSATIQGQVVGLSADDVLSGRNTPHGLPATVACDGNSTTAGSDGRFSLTAVRAGSYACDVSLSGYSTASIRVPGGSAQTVTLNLTGDADTSCQPTSGAASSVTCPQLALGPSALTGQVTRGGKPLAGASINCLDVHSSSAATPIHGTSEANGTYTIKEMPAATYGCFASAPDGISTYARVAALPGKQVSQTFALCGGACQRVTYHGGQVMHTQTVYTIYWLPAGTQFDPAGNGRYEQATSQYFRDIGGSKFYGMLSQYSDFQGPIQNVVTFKGTAVDHTPYQHCYAAGPDVPCTPAMATTSDPLKDVDIQAEIDRVIRQQHWQITDSVLFVIYLPVGAKACGSIIPGYGSCNFAPSGPYWCGYHSLYTNSQQINATYAVISDPLTAANGCLFNAYFAHGAPAPNGSQAVDSAIQISSHEQFEAATDPSPGAPGWISDDPQDQSDGGGEIGDVCVSTMPSPDASGANVTLHGHGYFLQGEWSDAAQKCVLPS